MSSFERAFRRQVGPMLATGYRGLPDSHTERVALVLTHARSLGCDCNPDVTVPPIRRGEVTDIVIAHDDWCALLKRREAARG